MKIIKNFHKNRCIIVLIRRDKKSFYLVEPISKFSTIYI